MRILEVFRNGERLCAAGIQGDAVVNASLACIQRGGRDELSLSVGGLVSATGEHVMWTTLDLNAGDRIRVDILESGSADESATRKRPEPEKELEARKTYVREMAKRLGWRVIEQSDIG